MKLDAIGDVHGRRAELEYLLSTMGYAPVAGAWRHPERQAVFVGDLVDRGADVPGVLALVKAMVDAGAAQIILGNHEFNLLCWYTPDGQGDFLRSHKNEAAAEQIKQSRPLFDGNPDLGRMYLDWFRSLPVKLEIGGARFVHAYWGFAELRELGDRVSLNDCGWSARGWRKTALGRAFERLTKGPEFRLPCGHHVMDRAGIRRTIVRAACWKDGHGKTLPEMVVSATTELPDIPFPQAGLDCYEPYGQNEPPVFIGHYGLNTFPGLLAENVACVDFRRSADQSTIGAYRWDGERVLDEAKFVRL